MATFEFRQWLADWIESQACFAFEWDLGNRTKNFIKHGITIKEAESVFQLPEAIRVLGEQVSPKAIEPRYGILGLTDTLHHVFVCFTIRGAGIRIIHIRKMNKKERSLYAKLCKE
jgi:uncharacterized DUF497 family protein